MSYQSDLFQDVATLEEAAIIEPMSEKFDDATINYEYPLHERVRTYLRLEHLKQLLKPEQTVDATNYSRYFDALFAILELCERSDVRTDVQKDLDRRRARYKSGLNIPMSIRIRCKPWRTGCRTPLSRSNH